MDFLNKKLHSKYGGISLLLLFTLVLYSPLRDFEMLAIDDGMHMENNPRLWPLTLENVRSFWTEPYENAYTPVTYTAWMLLANWARRTPEQQKAAADFMHPNGLKYDAGIFHLGNLAIHLISIAVVYGILFLLFKNIPTSLVGTALFAFHPLQVEAVCWITGLRDVMAGALSLLSLLAYIKYVQKTSPETLTFLSFQHTYSNPWFLLSFFLFFLSVLSKSSALVIPAFIVLLALTRLQRPFWPTLMAVLPWLGFILPIITVFTRLNGSVAERVVFNAPLEGRIIVALDAISFYFYKLLFPFNQAMDYGRTPQFVLKEFPYFWTVIATSLLLGTLFYGLGKRKYLNLFTAVALFISGLVPVLGMNPFIFQHISTVADRYVYLSLFGAAFFFAHLFSTSSPSPRKMGLFLFLIGFWYARSWAQIPTWKDNLSLFTSNLKHNPNSWLAANDLGTVYENKQQYRKAAELYKRAAEISGIPSAWNNYGATSLKADDFLSAIEGFKRALVASNYSHWAYNNLAAAYARSGNHKEALTFISKAQQSNPGSKIIAQNSTLIKNRDPSENLRVLRSSQDEG